jgi:ribosome-associated toxin RatA of RatAB toxin-antitoxin module
MANYVATIRTPWSAERAFAYMADFRNFEKWDPGVSKSTFASGTAPGVGTSYDVKVTGTELRYVTREYEPPTRTEIEARSGLLTSYDIVDITPTETGCDVTYDATLKLNGVLGLADPILGLFFGRIGDRAAKGMAEALEGEKIR